MANQITVATVREVIGKPAVARWVLTAAMGLSLVTGLAAGGLLGGRSIGREGDLSETSSLLSPAAQSLPVWAVLGVLFGLLVVWQWLPQAGEAPRATAVRHPAAAALLLAGLWFLSAWAGGVLLGAVLATALVVCLAWGLVRLSPLRASFGVRQLTQAPFALGLGWALVVGLGNLACLLTAGGASAFRVSAHVWAMLALIGALGIGMSFVRYLPGRAYTGLGMAWGLVWVGYARLLGSPRSIPVALVAGVSSGLILLATVAVYLSARTRARHG